ncbi:Cytochrome bd ubiquinol oxidase subunit 1 [uncultured Desulfobacterium sp.]|uniref:Cytochrome bd ubiquinol oxidase subunit 1 n=1 Tax=uncultured Desulfobacterium sp. TaxID=201089 RepID=A0A445N2E4_9BACT|nr:Cytochrome bd ubiquinol oxidase subunit 1 [uncultured Desulfobacterium sp.]
MDVLFLSRLQFAAATFFHFLFVPLTLGLSILVAIMETKYARTGEEIYLRMTKFWSKLFLVNFAVGIVTGITLEFQFGTNWSRYSSFVGDIFGSLLAIEATAAFFLESTFIGVWVFGWKKLSAKAHAFVMWLVAFASTLSAIWILTANAWMQHPVGYVLKNGRAELESFADVVFQGFAVLEFIHTASAAYILSAFFVMGISAYHLLKKQHVEFFSKSFRMALVFGLIFSVLEVVEGHLHGSDLAEKQPTKLAAMEAHWQTMTYAPKYLFAWPDQQMEKNSIEIIPIPGVLSLLAKHTPSAEVKGLKDFPKEDRPPVLITYLSFNLMVGLGFYFVLVTLIGWLKRNKLMESPWYLKLMLYSIPLPYIACELGWTVAEVGRQPWIVYGLMKTADAFSPIATSQVLTSLVAFILVYGLLGAVGFYLIIKNAKQGPNPA